jgi:hypothetical protein
VHKMESGQAQCQDLVKRIIRKFISYFLTFILFSMNFRNLNEFQENLNRKSISIMKKRRIVHGPKWANDCSPQPGRPAGHGRVARPAGLGHRPA